MGILDVLLGSNPGLLGSLFGGSASPIGIAPGSAPQTPGGVPSIPGNVIPQGGLLGNGLLGNAARGALYGMGAAGQPGPKGFLAGMGQGAARSIGLGQQRDQFNLQQQFANAQMARSNVDMAQKLDEANRWRQFNGQPPLTMQQFMSGNWGDGQGQQQPMLNSTPSLPPGNGGAPAANGQAAAPDTGGSVSADTGMAPLWKRYLDLGNRALRFGLPEVAKQYFDAAKTDPDYEAAKARGLIPAKVEEQQALMPGKVQEAGLSAGAESEARLPFQKSLAATESGLAYGREASLAKLRSNLQLQNAGPIAAAEAQARLPSQVQLAQEQAKIQATSPTQLNLNTEKLRDDFRSDKNVINYQTVVPIYTSMQDALKRPGGASDLNLVYGLAKILDPASVVREGETWMVRDTSNLPQEIQGLIGKVATGQRLPDDLRLTLVAEAGSRVAALKQANDVAANFYAAQAKTLGVDPSRIIYDITPEPSKKPPDSAKPLSDDDLVKKYGAH